MHVPWTPPCLPLPPHLFFLYVAAPAHLCIRITGGTFKNTYYCLLPMQNLGHTYSSELFLVYLIITSKALGVGPGYKKYHTCSPGNSASHSGEPLTVQLLFSFRATYSSSPINFCPPQHKCCKLL